MMTRKKARMLSRQSPQAIEDQFYQQGLAIDSLEKKVQEQQRIIAQLSKNSSNSHKPPSSDDITKPKSKNKKKKKKEKPGKRSPGGQPGHPKHERPLFPPEEINASYDYTQTLCPHCADQMTPMEDQDPQVIQQVEIPQAPIRIEEHLSYPMWCETCQTIHYGPLPPDVVKEGLFKERITALTAYLKHVCHASYSTIRKFFRDILHLHVSRGYLRKVIEKVGRSLQAPYEELLHRLPFEKTVNVDESGHKENGAKFWTWVFKADLYVLFKIDKSRGSKVLLEVLGNEFHGVLGCDYFSAYRKYMKDCSITLQFCLAHLIRDLRYLIGLPDRATQAYGKKLLAQVKILFQIIHNQDEMTPNEFQEALANAKQSILDVALHEAPSRLDQNGNEEKTEAQNIRKRFLKHGKEYFTFITTPGMDPTNNIAEQAIRFIVIDRRITQGTRSLQGRISCERIWTVIATCALQGRSAYTFILQAVHAYFQKKLAPSLMPDPG
jgi:transposase